MSLLLLLSGHHMPLTGQPVAVVEGEQWNPEQRLPEEDRQIIPPEQIVAGVTLVTDPKLIARIIQYPNEIHSLSWWEFQEFVSELLRQSGHEVTLGPRGRDEGIDVIAERRSEVGIDLTLVQCKRNAPDNKVTSSVVKQLYGIVEQKGATRGLVVTTSTFTAPAQKFIESVRYRVSGQDLVKLQAWLHKMRESS